MEVTPEQALAFLDSLVGYIDVADQQGRPKSEHARTHLEAALGYGNVGWEHDVQQFARTLQGSQYFDNDSIVRINCLLDYLSVVVTALKDAGQKGG